MIVAQPHTASDGDEQQARARAAAEAMIVPELARLFVDQNFASCGRGFSTEPRH